MLEDLRNQTRRFVFLWFLFFVPNAKLCLDIMATIAYRKWQKKFSHMETMASCPTCNLVFCTFGPHFLKRHVANLLHLRWKIMFDAHGNFCLSHMAISLPFIHMSFASFQTQQLLSLCAPQLFFVHLIPSFLMQISFFVGLRRSLNVWQSQK